jgi:hypothetical protein
MDDAFPLAYLLIRAGLGGLLVFGALLLIGVSLAVAVGGGKLKSLEFQLCVAGFLAALALLSGGAMLEGVLSGEVLYVLRKSSHRLAKRSEEPGLYWGCIAFIGAFAIACLFASVYGVLRALKPKGVALANET